MATKVLEQTEEEVKSVLEQAQKTLEDIDKNYLSNVEVRVPNTSVSVIKAVRALFGEAHIRADGSTIITYAMYSKVNDLLRTAGSLKLKELL